jgi:hypothetical protein
MTRFLTLLIACCLALMPSVVRADWNSLTAESSTTFYSRWASLSSNNTTDSQAHYNLSWTGSSSYSASPLGRNGPGNIFNLSSGNNPATSATYTQLQGVTNFTISGWVRVTTVGSTYWVFGSGSGSSYVGMSVGTDGSVSFWVNNGTSQRRYSAASVIASNTWAHFACVYDGSLTAADRAMVYVNGTRVDIAAVGTIPTTSPATLNVFRLGGLADSASFALVGSENDVRIHLRSLTSAEVTEMYGGPEPTNSVAPSFTGTISAGNVASGSIGTWADPSNGTVTTTYQWQEATDSGGTGAANISGATSINYTVSSGDVVSGNYIRLRVTQTNTGGATTASSSWQLVVGGFWKLQPIVIQ